MTGPYTEPAFDPAASGPQPSAEEIKQAASDSVKSGVDIRQRIHDVTLLALKSRRFDRHGMREVVQAVTDGMALGAEQSRADLRQALAEAFRGMDDALTRSAEAGGAALRAARGDRQGSLRHRDQAGARHDEEARGRLPRRRRRTRRRRRARRCGPSCARSDDARATTGTETGRIAAQTMTELGAALFGGVARCRRWPGIEVATEVGTRFAQVASGILGGIADALADTARQEAASKARRCCRSRSARCGTSRVCTKSRRS